MTLGQMAERKSMKMRGILVGVVLFAISAACADCDAWDRAEARARELCARMTLEEKAGELAANVNCATVE